MPTPSLDIIPVEILALVCEYVELSHRPSLLSFALANKRCHSVAKRLFFHTIRFSPNSQSQLELDVDECIRILERNASFSHVRTLLVTGARWGKNYNLGAVPTVSAADGDAPSWSFGLPLSLSEIVDGDKDRLQGLERHSALIPPWTPDKPRLSFISTDAGWQPLARLVQILQGLDDVLYGSPDQVPPCLLRALLRYQPRCRLHVFVFTLRSLRLPETDPDELALVTAPCLYSIWMWYHDTDGFDECDEPAYHAEAIDSMVRGLAPNLKEVHLFLETSSGYDSDDNPLPSRFPWKGFTSVGADSTCMPAHLKSLELGREPRFGSPRLALDKEVADRWATNKLSSLRALRLSLSVNPEALGSLIRANNFPCLITLLFTCAEEQERTYYDDVKDFIHGLPQLTSLEIIAWPPSISLAAALPHRLRELWLRTQNVLGQSLDKAAILELAARCPCIDTLALKIRRSRGSAAEVALYKAIGRFSKLRRLVLTLDASPVPWFPVAPPHEPQGPLSTRAVGFDTAIDPSFDESEKQYMKDDLYPYRHGHVRDAFINTAVDETLARAIFRTVCAAKASFYGHSAALALDRMAIQPEGALSFPSWSSSWGLSPFVETLSRPWLLERDVRDDAREVIRAREIDKRGRLQWAGSIGKYQKPKSPYMGIFRRIWPKSLDVSTRWYDDWHSWPLDETA